MPISRVLSEKERKEIFTDNWPRRRVWMKLTLILLWLNAEVVLAYSIWVGSALGMQAFFALLGGVLSIICFYVFGAVYDDHSKRRWLPHADYGRDTAPPSEEEDE